MESNNQRRAGLVVAAAALLLAVVAVVRLAGGDGDDGAASVDSFPSSELTAPGDTTIDSGDLVGGPMVVNFWYAACPPCANELQHFAAVHAEYGDEVRFVGVNAIDTVDEMTEFAGDRGVTYELFQDPLAELQTEMRLTSFPTTVFVAADGTVVDRTGVLDEAGLESRVLDLLSDQR